MSAADSVLWINDVEANIAETHYFTAADGVHGAAVADGVDDGGSKLLAQVTFCLLVLRNGTKLVGVNYGPIDPTTFDPVLGRTLARRDAVDQIWPLMGYALRERLRETPPAAAHVVEPATGNLSGK